MTIEREFMGCWNPTATPFEKAKIIARLIRSTGKTPKPDSFQRLAAKHHTTFNERQMRELLAI